MRLDICLFVSNLTPSKCVYTGSPSRPMWKNFFAIFAIWMQKKSTIVHWLAYQWGYKIIDVLCYLTMPHVKKVFLYVSFTWVVTMVGTNWDVQCTQKLGGAADIAPNMPSGREGMFWLAFNGGPGERDCVTDVRACLFICVCHGDQS